VREAGRRVLVPLAVLAGLGEAALAARPMATDDSSTAPAGICQTEAWTERADDGHTLTPAPACGLTDELELDTSVSRALDRGAASGAPVRHSSGCRRSPGPTRRSDKFASAPSA
jgi:hypothetical protein